MAKTYRDPLVVIHSGGLDSSVLLKYLHNSLDCEAYSLSIDYGQRHKVELEYADKFCREIGVPHKVVDLSSVNDLFGNSALTRSNVPVPDGHYEAETMRQTVVPNRNMIFLSIAAAWAISLGQERKSKKAYIAFAAHGGDHAIYADCRQTFIDQMRTSFLECTDELDLQLLTPFVGASKASLVRTGAGLVVPFELTWSCYKGGEKHCGTCGTCTERKEAFQDSGMADPTEYMQ